MLRDWTTDNSQHTTQDTFFGRSCQRDASIAWGRVLADAWLVASAVCVTPHPPCKRQGGVSDLRCMLVGGTEGAFCSNQTREVSFPGMPACGLRETCSSSSPFRTGILSSRRWLLVVLQITSHHFNAVGSGCKGGMGTTFINWGKRAGREGKATGKRAIGGHPTIALMPASR